MFSNLTDLSYVRNAKQAFGFYLSYLILTLILSTLIGEVLASRLFKIEFDITYKLGNIFAVIWCVTLSALVAKQKGFLHQFKIILLVLLSGVLAFIGGYLLDDLIGGDLLDIGGGLLGLIPAAYFTTIGKHDSSSNHTDSEDSPSEDSPGVGTP